MYILIFPLPQNKDKKLYMEMTSVVLERHHAERRDNFLLFLLKKYLQTSKLL